MDEPEMISVDEAMRRLRERLEQGPAKGVSCPECGGWFREASDIPGHLQYSCSGVDVDAEICSGCGVDFRDVSNLYGHQSLGDCTVFMDRRDLWSRPLVTAYERARRIVFLRSRICNSPLLTRAYFAVEGPVYRVVWEVQHRYLLHTLKGIALEDYRVFIEDYEHWMSGSWESYMEERGYL